LAYNIRYLCLASRITSYWA